LILGIEPSIAIIVDAKDREIAAVNVIIGTISHQISPGE
jgi:hypothetical protein